jgi:hypothetical protein
MSFKIGDKVRVIKKMGEKGTGGWVKEMKNSYNRIYTIIGISGSIVDPRRILFKLDTGRDKAILGHYNYHYIADNLQRYIPNRQLKFNFMKEGE